MPLIKKKQLSVSSSFAAGGSGELALAANGVLNTHINSLAGSKLTDASVTAAKLDQALLNLISRGTSTREAVLTIEQFIEGGSAGIAPAALLVMTNRPAENDQVIIKNGNATETYTFVNARSQAFEVARGADVAEARVNFIAAINGDSEEWTATAETTLSNFAANTIVVTRKTASEAADDRIYKTTGGGFLMIDFAGKRYDATVSSSGIVSSIDSSDLTGLSASDPVSTTFGFGEVLSNTIDGELRIVMADNIGYTFDKDAKTWSVGLGASGLTPGSVGPTELSSSVAGAALAGGDGDPLDVQVDNSTIEIAANALQLKAQGIGVTHLGAIAGNGLTGGSGSALAVLAADASLSVGTGGVSAAVPSADDLGLTPASTITGGDNQDSGLTVGGTPIALAHEFTVHVNGQKEIVGNGSKTNCSCWFSGDNGATARAFGDIASGDKFYWNCTAAGYDLDTGDEIDFGYLTHG